MTLPYKKRMINNENTPILYPFPYDVLNNKAIAIAKCFVNSLLYNNCKSVLNIYLTLEKQEELGLRRR